MDLFTRLDSYYLYNHLHPIYFVLIKDVLVGLFLFKITQFLVYNMGYFFFRFYLESYRHRSMSNV